MRRAIAVTLVVAAGLVVVNMLGVAAAEAPTTPTTAPVRTVSVEGVATVPIAQDANLAAATAVYRQAMANAMADGQSKAEFLAGKAAVTLGGVQSIVEGGGSIGCTGVEESSYPEYEGERPDFGSPATSISSVRTVAAPVAASVRKPAVKRSKKKKKKKKRAAAKKASAATCTLSAAVALVYAIE